MDCYLYGKWYRLISFGARNALLEPGKRYRRKGRPHSLVSR